MPDNSEKNLANIIKVEIRDKNLKAFILIKGPAPNQNFSITYEDVISVVEKSGVKYGINHKLIREIVEGNKWNERFLIAEGKPSTQGDNAKFEFYFPTDKSFRPQIKEDGHIDYKEINIVNSVEKDTVLIKKTAPTYGEEGIDVTGADIAAPFGKDIEIVTGPGTYRDPNNAMLIKASVDGIVFYNDKSHTIEVQQLFSIKDSVDYSTGNINVKSSVDIKGDVKPFFSVTTPYNVQVNGLVEQATITCGGILTVRGGIVGDGKQLIKVGGDLHAGYINNQHIKCNGSVYVNMEIRNSFIECDEEIVVVKGNGIIIGGKIIAKNKVNAASIGNLYSIPTEVEVGVDYGLKEKISQKKILLSELQKKLDEFKNKISSLDTHFSDSVSSNVLGGFYGQWKDCSDQCETVKKELVELESEFYNVLNPTVEVSKTIYPGVIIKIKFATYEVKEELSHVKFRLVDDEIVHSSIK
jgi:hypothetical protein